MDAERLTPVEIHEGIYTKRDDLYVPFGEKTVNGGKLRQCFLLVQEIKKEKYSGLISCCSIYSPQAPITAAVGNYFNLPTKILYGATNYHNLRRLKMPRIAKSYGAEICIASKSGIHKILYEKAREIAKKENLFVVDYGFNIIDYPDLMFKAISRQVRNIPDELDNLVITCGSGITSIGIILGIHQYKKHVKKIYLIATAPSRRNLIDKTLRMYGIEQEYKIIDLFHQKGFKYEKGLNEKIDGIKLHPQYEAKAYRWIKENLPINERNLLWIVGSKPEKGR